MDRLRDLLAKLPLWLRQTAVLIAVWVVAMVVVSRWTPWMELDQWLFVRASHAGQLASSITVVDVQPSPAGDPLATRRLITDFLKGLANSKQQPAAVMLDFTFDPCQTPCEGPRKSVRDALVAAIAGARGAHIAVYATQNLTPSSVDPYGRETTGALEDLDPDIYGAQGLAGAAGHTLVHVADGSGMAFYHPCYRDVTMPAGDRDVTGPAPTGLARGEDLWALVWRVQPNFDVSVCETHPVTFSVGPRLSAADAAYSTIPRTPPTFYTITPSDPFPAGMDLNDYVIVGTLEQDTLNTDAQLAGTPAGAVWEKLHGPGSLNIPGPELLAWALSDRLAQIKASGAPAGAYHTVHPLGRALYPLVAAFSGMTVLAFVACFHFLRRFRLKAARRRLPWIAAAASLAIGIGAFAAMELLMSVGLHQDQPQVTLISFSIALSAVLSGVRGSQMMTDLGPEEDERYDYDVFISYSHDDTSWVRQNVYAPLAKAKLPNGKPLSIFFDKSAIYIGDDWRKKLTLAVLNSRFVIAVYSENYFRRQGKGYCIFELDCAYNTWIQRGKASRSLLPVMRGTVEVPPEYGQAQFVSLDDEPDIVERLCAEIVERLSRSEPAN